MLNCHNIFKNKQNKQILKIRLTIISFIYILIVYVNLLKNNF